jgi:FixJ family two-component response regulator
LTRALGREDLVENKVLFVDDEESILQGYRRILHSEFCVATATGGDQGMAAIRTSGPFAVVVSDMRMPGMNGAQFLAKVHEKAPDSVRILLTGYSDLDAVISAVNEGNIFRYLTKPCEKTTLLAALHSGVAQYNEIMANKDLVKKAQLVRSSLDWDAHDIGQGSDVTTPSVLPDSAAAREYMGQIFGTERLGVVVLVKLSILHMIEDRYGPEVAEEYVNGAIQLLAPSVGPKDRMFQWNHDVLMLVIRRPLSLIAARIEIARLMQNAPEHICQQNGTRVMVAAPSVFDLLPVSRFSSFDDMLAVFNIKLTGAV